MTENQLQADACGDEPAESIGKRFEGDDNQLSRDNLVKRWDDFCDGIMVSCEHGCD
eukprot:CAMPEP_0116069982 /NCGR_PEP_ID=MMETSP0322-20121206/12681_1 /TAXON_ID=163516 /ORGANISM="Leptocylindrus danicus var. apora, Strain B651" /LENGTH=55 /DNA_ID=CAMNT_0003557589 /DNA_START=909 /DNA_END=1074 /DNA_ORIENTATION=+